MSPETIKLLVLALYVAGLLAIGAIASRRIRNQRDYFAAGKNLGFLSAAFSARATGESAWLLIGLTGMGAAVGLQAMWIVLGEVVGVGLAWLWLAKPFKRATDRYDSITIPDYLESRFDDKSHRLRLVAALTLVVFVTIYVSAQLHATGDAFKSFLGWNYNSGAFAGYGVVLLYILTGGFLAVVWSDVVQGLLMFLGLTLLPLWAIAKRGGFGELLERAREIDPGLLTAHGGSGWTQSTILSTIAFVAIGLGFLGSPQIFVRFLALRSESEIKKGATVALVWTLLADSGAVFAGLFGRAILTRPGQDLSASVLGSNGESVLPLLVENLFPVFIVGIYVAVVLSAIMSTIDSLLVLAASAAVRDVYQKVMRPELTDESLTKLARIATFALATVALVLALVVAHFNEGQSVFWFVIFGWTGIAATFCPTIILSLFWSKFTRTGALAAMITGFVCVLLFKFVLFPEGAPLYEYRAIEEMVPAFFGSFLVGILVSLLTSREIPAQDT